MTKHRSQEERREQILAGARACFIERGFATARMDDIAREAGLSKGGVYFHFASKRDIFDALVEEEHRRCMDVLTTEAATQAPATVKLAALANAYLDMLVGDPDQNRFLVVIGEVAWRDPDVASRLADVHESFIRVLTELVQGGIDAGEIREVDPRAAAQLLKAIIDGVEASYTIGCEVDLPKLAATGIDILNHGLVRR